MLKRSLPPLAALLLLAVLTPLPVRATGIDPGMAFADGVVLHVKADAVMSAACPRGAVRYRVSVDASSLPDVVDWWADVTVTEPSGVTHEHSYLPEPGWRDAAPGTSLDPRGPGWHAVAPACLVSRAYRVGALVTLVDAEGNHEVRSLEQSTVPWPPARSVVRVERKPLRAHGWRYTVTVTKRRESAHGDPWSDAKVQVQARTCGAWRTVRTPARTNDRGRAVFDVVPPKRWNTTRTCGVPHRMVPFRVRAPRSTYVLGSTSAVFRVVRR